ncbi:arginyltransferase [uncultured Cocleimonas sp.]|uniref:arginyltransferase n=1 Tax=uncultured Cocleimonas sp. TaxID=1051587 RepID=UPI00261A8D7A|nr:arginyltransferase [uncultured Cocleimonas sp.]
MKLDQPLKIFPTGMHPCSYLPGLIARNAVVDPDYEMTPHVYDYLIQNGFRRSGEQVYRPYCHTCEECVTTRIPVADFSRSKSQRRNWKLNSDLTVEINTSGFRQEYLPLYQRYLESRHESQDYEGVEKFLLADWCDIDFYEFYSEDESGNKNLIGVAVTDVVKSGLSAVYTFFDPEEGNKRGLGVYAVLWQVEYAQQQQLEFVYPGFWIKDCRKMNYKTRYQPIEGLIKGKWIALQKDA